MHFPFGERAIGIQLAAHFDEAARTEVGPRHFLLAGPIALYRLSGGLGQARRFVSGLAIMLAAVARAGIRHDHAHALFGQVEVLRQFAAHAEGTLRSRPHSQGAVRPLRQRRPRLQRHVCDVGHRVGGQAGSAGPAIPAVLLEIGIDILGRRFRFHRLPIGLQGGHGLLGGESAGRRDADEIALAHHLDARHGFRRGAIERQQRGPERGRIQHLPVEHPGERGVVRTAVRAGDDFARTDFGQRRSGDLPFGGRRQRHVGRDGAGEHLSVSQLAESGRPAARRHLAIGHLDGGALHHPLLRCQVHQRFARRRRGPANHRPHLRRGLAAHRAHIVGGEFGIAHHHADGRHGRTQLLGYRLRQRRAGVLSHFHFAGVYRHDAGLADVQPGA